MKRCSLILLLTLFVSPVVGQEEGPPLNVYYGEIPEGEHTYYVATDGDNTNPGTEEEPWAAIDYAVDQVERGDVIVVRGGVYEYDHTIRIEGTSGFTDQMIVLTAYPGEVPILDFSNQPKERNVHGIRLNAHWWHLIGITIRNASHNGIRMDGSFNVLEQVTAYGNHDTGIHMAGGAVNNLVKNCDSFRNFNYDPVRSQDDGIIGGNADGFSAKFSVGSGNRFVGCRAWENSDDGWDLWEANNVVVIDSSWAFGNGDESVFGDFDNFRGNGNGFKLGGGSPAPEVGHIVRRSLAFDNFGSSGNAKGFDYNNNAGAFTLVHNTAYHNGRNFYFPLTPTHGQAVFLNNLSAVVDDEPVTPPFAVVAGNSWQRATEVTADMFMSVDTELAKAPRQEDGSLPENDFLRPVPGTFIVDGGVPLTVPFYGAAPDMGVHEYVDGEPTQPWVDRGAGEFVSDFKVYDLEHAENWTLRSDLEIGNQAYGDTDATISSVDDLVVVEEWIQTAAASRTKNYLFPAAELSVVETQSVFVAHADAITVKPEWLSGYEDSGYDLTISDGEAEHVMSLYALAPEPGEDLALGRNSLDGTEAAPMYVVLVGWISPVSVEDGAQPGIESRLDDIYPNPVRSTLNISFTLANTANVSIKIFDGMGREVAEVARGLRGAGEHRLAWDAGRLASGVYYCQMIANGHTTVRKLLRVR